jgi:hypothetical protein
MNTKAKDVAMAILENDAALARNENRIEKVSGLIGRLILELNDAGEHLADLLEFEDGLKAQRAKVCSEALND